MPGICLRKSVIKAVLLLSAAMGCCLNLQAQSLYQELGGEPGLHKLTHELVLRIQRNPHLRESFKASNLRRLQSLLQEQFCEISDGPCRYTGDDMQTVHRGLAITELQFNALVEDLQDALAAQAVPARVQHRLLARLAPMKSLIVTPKQN